MLYIYYKPISDARGAMLRDFLPRKFSDDMITFPDI